MRLDNERGSALLLVLCLVALLAALLSDWTFSTLVDLRLTETFRDSSRAYYLANGGLEAGRQLLRNDTNDYDSPLENWGIGIPDYNVADGASVTVTLQDEDGRFNLNRLVDATGDNPAPLQRARFLRLLTRLDIADGEALADALLDWLDRNDSPAARGAESAWYRTLQPSRPARNALLDTVDELLLVRGFTSEIVARLRPCVTVSSGPLLNVNSAPLAVLESWEDEVDAAVLQRFVNERDNEPLRTLAEVRDALGVDAYASLNRNLDLGVSSSCYRILSEARIGDGSCRVEALLRKSGDRLLLRRIQ